MEWIVLSAFCAILLTFLWLNLPLLGALAAGLLLFLGYGRYRGLSWRALGRMCIEGVRTVKNILITFFLIGMLTALWRAAGTLPVIVCRAGRLIHPRAFLPTTFLLNCLISTLTGTSFGTAATMGVICATMGAAIGVDPRWVGGAILSGAFFGDRCSPVSTSALLVAELTCTDIYDNIRRMVRTALAPFLLTCGIYGAVSALTSAGTDLPNLETMFQQAFKLQWIAILPAGIILLMSLLRVNVRLSMAASILAALPLCVGLQGMNLPEVARTLVLGYHAPTAEVGKLIDGGGMVSMLRVAGIVCLSSSYSKLFEKTGLLNGATRAVNRLARRTTPYIATLCTAVVTAMIACNQTLSILLTRQLCGALTDEGPRCAIDLEDTAVVVAPLIPWSIAGAVPLATVSAPLSAMAAACYLYLIPLWRAATSLWHQARK